MDRCEEDEVYRALHCYIAELPKELATVREEEGHLRRRSEEAERDLRAARSRLRESKEVRRRSETRVKSLIHEKSAGLDQLRRVQGKRDDGRACFRLKRGAPEVETRKEKAAVKCLPDWAEFIKEHSNRPQEDCREEIAGQGGPKRPRAISKVERHLTKARSMSPRNRRRRHPTH